LQFHTEIIRIVYKQNGVYLNLKRGNFFEFSNISTLQKNAEIVPAKYLMIKLQDFVSTILNQSSQENIDNNISTGNENSAN